MIIRDEEFTKKLIEQTPIGAISKTMGRRIDALLKRETLPHIHEVKIEVTNEGRFLCISIEASSVERRIVEKWRKAIMSKVKKILPNTLYQENWWCRISFCKTAKDGPLSFEDRVFHNRLITMFSANDPDEGWEYLLKDLLELEKEKPGSVIDET
jgi:hypothetical protein